MQIFCHGLKDEDFQVEFTDHKIFLGRDVSNSIPVSAEGISRYHAILIEEDDALFLQDNDSMNGTFLNNDQIRNRQQLANGDIIQIGYCLIKVEFLPDRNVVLDFMPPEETENLYGGTIVSPEQASGALSPQDVDISLEPGEPASTPPAEDDVEHTMIASDTMFSGSSSGASGQSPFSGDDIEHTMLIQETPFSGSSSAKGQFHGGTEIGKYVIIKRIGKGGMGEVYLAKHKTLGTFRAIKVLLNDSEHDMTRFLDRFVREAKLASEIRHPNVVGVMDVETDSACGVPYIVMEYVDGGSLRNSLTASVRLSEEQAVVIVEAVASALQAAEEHRIVHRDIKPDNIMFTKRGEVKLADLGIAKSGDRNDLTKTNMMVGTPAYLPPEQAQNAKSVDARADIYSLGATFYEMLTGQQPYPGENSIEVLHKLFLEPVPDPRKINPGISAASATIVMKMMAKDPQNRFQNATELLDMMERTYPPHSAHEASELVKMAIAGECLESPEFTSGISSSALSLLWLRIPNKKFILPAAGLVFACCVLGIMFLFLEKKPAKSFSPETDGTAAVETETVAENGPDGTETLDENVPDGTETVAENVPDGTETVAESVPDGTETVAESVPDGTETVAESVPDGTETVAVNEKKYELQIKTTPDSDIRFILPDGRMILYSADSKGQLTITGLESGNYKLRISRDRYHELTSDFELKKDMKLNLPLNADSGPSRDKTAAVPNPGKTYELLIKTAPDSEIRLVCPDNTTRYYVPEKNGQFKLSELKPGNYRVIVLNEHYESLTRDVNLSGNRTINMTLKPGPLVVTTDKETSNGKDILTSLPEAIEHMEQFRGSSSIVFDKGYEIRLSSLSFGPRDYTIDGGSNNVSLFAERVSLNDRSVVRFENLSFRALSSINNNANNYRGRKELLLSGGRGSTLEFDSVTDDGKLYWRLSNNRIVLAGSSHLHNFDGNRASGNGSAYIRIENGSTLDNSTVDVVEYNVYGLLKNAFVFKSSNRNRGHVIVNEGGMCENLSVGRGVVEHCNGGVINGLKTWDECVYGYEPNAVLRGTVILGGPALEPVSIPYDRSIVGEETDIIFDLTSRTAKTSFRKNNSDRAFENITLNAGYPQQCDYLIQNMKAFLGAHSYTVRVRGDSRQEPGTYKLAGNASDFNSPVSLEIVQARDELITKTLSDIVLDQRIRKEKGKNFFPDVLSLGKSFTKNNKVYTLSLEPDSNGKTMLVLTISNMQK